MFFESDIKISESSKYPSIQRDLSFLIPGKIDFDKLYELAKKLGGSNLVTFKLFDLYQESEKTKTQVMLLISLGNQIRKL